MTKDQAQKVLDTKVQAVTALLADIQKVAVENSLSVFIPALDVDYGHVYGFPVVPHDWESSSEENWDSSSYSC